MNYENMSDLEINQAVAATMNLSWFLPPESKYNDSDRWRHSYHESVGEVVELPDYCNNPSDAWPIIVEKGISIDWPEDEFSVGTASAFIEDGIEAGVHFARKDEALRAAMIVYLMIQENNQ